MRVPFPRPFAIALVAAVYAFAPVALAFDEGMQLERLEDVPGDRDVADETSMEVGEASDKPKPPAPKTVKAPPPKPAAPPPPPPPQESIADAPPPRPEAPTASAPARGDAAPEIQYDEMGEPIKRRRRGGADYSSPLNVGMDLQFWFPSFDEYIVQSSVNPDDINGGGFPLTQKGVGIRLATEWIALERFGKLGIGGSLGFFGIFGQLAGPTAKLDVIGFPLEASLTYRFEYLRHQAIVPYVSGGFQAIFAKQSSDDGLATNFQMSPGYFVNAGIAINLRPFSRADAVRMDYNYGINDTYLIAEYTYAKTFNDPPPLNDKPDFSTSAFRAGLRFEY